MLTPLASSAGVQRPAAQSASVEHSCVQKVGPPPMCAQMPPVPHSVTAFGV
jgi:hypothetical protein